AYLARNVEALATYGQLVVIGLQGGVDAELNLAALLGKRAAVRATNLRGRPANGVGSKAEIIAEVREHVWPLVTEGAVVPVIHAELPINEVGDAHALLDSADTVGKVVLHIG
ncbi:zinc-binding dehydrogenase, partial [Nocardia cyriacigeorgica]